MTSRLVPIACLAGLLLAGCTGDGGEEGGGSKLAGKTESHILDPDAEVSGASGAGDGGRSDSAPGLGEIRGKVVDDAQLPVVDATVSLLGTENSTTTDRDGAFRFTNLTPGDFVVRVASEFYRVHEGAVSVRADRITQVTVTLVPQSDRGPGYRPHLHDYWGTSSELILMDFSFDWADAGSCVTDYALYGPAKPVMTSVYGPNQVSYWACFKVPDSDGALPPIVLPGTGKLRITLDWGSDVDVDAFIVGINTAPMSVNKYLDQSPLSKQEELVFDLEEGDADNGHQSFSLWEFRIRTEARSTPMTILGPIQIKMVMVKGELPVDPAHTDFWAGSDTYVSRDYASAVSGISSCCVEGFIKVSMDAKRLVPPGTELLKVRFGWESARAPGSPHDLDFGLWFKPANLPSWAADDEYRPLTPTKTEGTLKSYEIPLTSAETDAFYQTGSNVILMIRQPGQDLPYGVAEYEHKFHLEVISVKDPAFT